MSTDTCSTCEVQGTIKKDSRFVQNRGSHYEYEYFKMAKELYEKGKLKIDAANHEAARKA